ncbi:hypothetical protein FRX31_009133 [Thalictrum thalictroides]|uniref:Transposase MuDR plant domain-containing protein n=1 Tax=Thalictrum thalictroides TaxID=46969 RepID=A0A7J6WV41_THATH|nr:hypothetical protein FRX31_009133 [Thalictrum thalictroides]
MAWYFCSQCIPTVALHLLLNDSVRDIICRDDGELIDTCKDNEVCWEVVPTPFSIQQGLKSASWGKVFSCVRQVFDGGVEEFRELLVLYSIETGFSYIFKKNDRKRVTIVRKKKVDKGCAWMIHSVLKGGIFSIEKMNDVHTCRPSYKDYNHPKITSKVVKKLILKSVADKSQIKPKEIQDTFRRDYGMKLNYYLAYTEHSKKFMVMIFYLTANFVGMQMP